MLHRTCVRYNVGLGKQSSRRGSGVGSIGGHRVKRALHEVSLPVLADVPGPERGEKNKKQKQ